jgi:hypothetical protein
VVPIPPPGKSKLRGGAVSFRKFRLCLPGGIERPTLPGDFPESLLEMGTLVILSKLSFKTTGTKIQRTLEFAGFLFCQKTWNFNLKEERFVLPHSFKDLSPSSAGSIALGLKVKNVMEARCWWLTPVILATQEADIRKIPVQSQPGQIVHATSYLKKTLHKKAGGVAQGLGPEFKPQVQVPVPPKKKKKPEYHGSMIAT